MKKTLLYLPLAALLGILITIVPLIAVTQTENTGTPTTNNAFPQVLAPALKQLNGNSGTKGKTANDSTLTVLAVSLAIALAAYTVVRRRIPRQYDVQFRMPP